MTPDHQPTAPGGLHPETAVICAGRPGLLRLSVGCEHIDDLWNDLDSALRHASRPGNPKDWS